MRTEELRCNCRHVTLKFTCMKLPVLSTPPTVRELLVSALSRSPYQSAEELRSALSIKGKPATRQSVFKELRYLLRATVVVKSGRRYALSLAWIERSIQELEATAEAHAALLMPNLESGSQHRVRFSFRGLLRLKIFWSHLCLGSLKRSKSKLLLSWNPHPWAYLVLSEHERDMMDAIVSTESRMVKVVGSDKPLDKKAGMLWRRNEIVSYFRADAFPRDRHRYFSLVDDTLITVTLPKFSARALDRWYGAHATLSDEALRSLIDILSRAHPATVTMERGTRLVAKVQREFDKVIGRRSTLG